MALPPPPSHNPDIQSFEWRQWFVELFKVVGGTAGSTSISLHDLSNVDSASAGNGQVISFNSTSGQWEPNTLAGSAVWGGITGTLSAQTDLQSALDLKAPLASPSFTGDITLTDVSPFLIFNESDQGLNEKNWIVGANGTEFFINAFDDTLQSSNFALAIDRVGTVISTITLSAVNGITLLGPTTVEADFTIRDTNPFIIYDETSAAVDNGIWLAGCNGERYIIAAYNDLLTAGNTAFLIERTGTTVDSISLTATNLYTFGRNEFNSQGVDRCAIFRSDDPSCYIVLADDTLGTPTSTGINSVNGVMTLSTNGTGTTSLGTTAVTLDTSQHATFAQSVRVKQGAGGGVIFDTDLDTFIYASADDVLEFWTGAAQAVIINASQNATFIGKIFSSASTATRAGFNIAEGVAPTTPVNGDFWITAAGEANMRLNGVTVDLALGGDTFIFKASDESVTSSTTLQADNDLTFSVAANSTYEFEVYIRIISTSTTPDFKYDWTAPASTSYIVDVNGRNQAGTTVSDTFADLDPSPGQSVALGASVVAQLIGRGTVKTGGTSGSFTLVWSQFTSDATATTVQAGSYIKYRKIA